MFKSKLDQSIFSIQNKINKVTRDAKNAHLKYSYPTLGSVLDALKPHLEEHEISINFYTEPDEDNNWAVVARLAKEDEERLLAVPVEGIRGAKNQMQALGAAITYSRRYALLMAFNLIPDDDDAQCVVTTKPQERPPTFI